MTVDGGAGCGTGNDGCDGAAAGGDAGAVLPACAGRVSGTFAGGVAQEHNAAESNVSRTTGSRRMQEGTDGKDGLVEASGVAAQALAPGALYVVATPIGNLADLTVRAWWVLSHVDAIAAEDTRVTRTLLDRYRIDVAPANLIALHQHNERTATERVLALLRGGARVALVSDAGTPAISDPGAKVVQAVTDAGLRAIPIPGASSLTAALSVAGVNTGEVRFIGFLPQGARDRERTLRTIAAGDAAAVLFEAPHRIEATAAALAGALAPARRVTVAREITKRFETIAYVEAAALPAHGAVKEARGEYVLVIGAAPRDEATPKLDAAALRWLDAVSEALPPARAAAVAAQATGLAKDVLYREVMRRKGANASSAE